VKRSTVMLAIVTVMMLVGASVAQDAKSDLSVNLTGVMSKDASGNSLTLKPTQAAGFLEQIGAAALPADAGSGTGDVEVNPVGAERGQSCRPVGQFEFCGGLDCPPADAVHEGGAQPEGPARGRPDAAVHAGRLLPAHHHGSRRALQRLREDSRQRSVEVTRTGNRIGNRNEG